MQIDAFCLLLVTLAECYGPANLGNARNALRIEKLKNDLLGTVRRALRVLDLFTLRPAPLSPRAIAQALDLNISTVYHVLNTLVHEGYLRRDSAGSYALGEKVPRLHHGYIRGLGATPRLDELVRRLSEELDESAYLALRRGRQVVVAGIVESKQAVRVASLYVGYHENLHARALGKAVLAQLDEAEVRAHFADEPPARLTRNTQTSLEAILADLRRVRAHGYAEDNEEFLEGVCCIAAPFFSADGVVAGAIAIAQPSFRFHRSRDRVVAAVRRASAGASEKLEGIPVFG